MDKLSLFLFMEGVDAQIASDLYLELQHEDEFGCIVTMVCSIELLQK